MDNEQMPIDLAIFYALCLKYPYAEGNVVKWVATNNYDDTPFFAVYHEGGREIIESVESAIHFLNVGSEQDIRAIAQSNPKTIWYTPKGV